jgi:hypothetical protein
MNTITNSLVQPLIKLHDILVPEVYAAAPVNNPILGPNLQALNGVSFIQGLVKVSVTGGLIVGVLVFFFNLLVGGITYISSGGDKGKTEMARGKLTNAVIGIVVMFLIFAVVILTGDILGTDLLLIDITVLQVK